MRKINAWLFVTLDGVIEAPEEWVMADDDMFGAIEADYAKSERPAARSPNLRDVRRLVAGTRQRGPERRLDEQHAKVRSVDHA